VCVFVHVRVCESAVFSDVFAVSNVMGFVYHIHRPTLLIPFSFSCSKSIKFTGRMS